MKIVFLTNDCSSVLRFVRMKREKSFPFLLQFLYFQLDAFHIGPSHISFYMHLPTKQKWKMPESLFSCEYKAVRCTMEKSCFLFRRFQFFFCTPYSDLIYGRAFIKKLSINFTHFSHFSDATEKFPWENKQFCGCILKSETIFRVISHKLWTVCRPQRQFFTLNFHAIKNASLLESLELEPYFIFYRSHLTSNYICNSPHRRYFLHGAHIHSWSVSLIYHKVGLRVFLIRSNWANQNWPKWLFFSKNHSWWQTNSFRQIFSFPSMDRQASAQKHS